MEMQYHYLDSLKHFFNYVKPWKGCKRVCRVSKSPRFSFSIKSGLATRRIRIRSDESEIGHNVSYLVYWAIQTSFQFPCSSRLMVSPIGLHIKSLVDDSPSFCGFVTPSTPFENYCSHMTCNATLSHVRLTTSFT